ncbi:hypothetical protein KM043_013257 [Ampulex compressa]|nr:hypothetical protein KM043_013257 [Ampulex compressa]
MHKPPHVHRAQARRKIREAETPWKTRLGRRGEEASKSSDKERNAAGWSGRWERRDLSGRVEKLPAAAVASKLLVVVVVATSLASTASATATGGYPCPPCRLPRNAAGV